jgi:tRNA dimethylallyltransferase
MDRDILYRRIEERVDHMLDLGFIDEVKDLHKSGYTLDLFSMQSLGYKQISQYLHGKRTLTEAVADIKKETRQFAKRQYTWFRRDPLIRWIHFDPFASLDELLLNVCNILKDIH